MSSDDERVILVSKEWLTQLKSYLLPEERWTDSDNFPSVILWTMPNKRLIFRRESQ